jgi:hypothetical protein
VFFIGFEKALIVVRLSHPKETHHLSTVFGILCQVITVATERHVPTISIVVEEVKNKYLIIIIIIIIMIIIMIMIIIIIIILKPFGCTVFFFFFHPTEIFRHVQ